MMLICYLDRFLDHEKLFANYDNDKISWYEFRLIPVLYNRKDCTKIAMLKNMSGNRAKVICLYYNLRNQSVGQL